MADGPAMALQTALISRLRGYAPLAAKVAARVHDTPPQGVVYPYVALGDIDKTPMRDACSTAWDVLFVVEVHSRPGEGTGDQGRVEATRIAEIIVDALEDQDASLSIAGFTAAWLEFRTQAVARAADGKSFQASVVFATVLEPV